MSRPRKRRVCYSYSDMVRLLLWFTSQEPILTPSERAEYVERYCVRKT